jgi:hypothetical protein
MRRIKMGIWATIGTALKVANVVKVFKENKTDKRVVERIALQAVRDKAAEAAELEEYEEIDRLREERTAKLGMYDLGKSQHWHSDPALLMGYPPEDGGTNPKAGLGALKAPMGFSPPTAIIEMEAVMAGGAYKYGAYNFRDTKIDAMTYIGAIDRHFKLWQDGVDIDEESGQSHLAHIMACCALVIDSMHTNMLVDNRHKSGLVQGVLNNSADRYNAFTARHKGVGDVTE